jgi:hypothetical protein
MDSSKATNAQPGSTASRRRVRHLCLPPFAQPNHYRLANLIVPELWPGLRRPYEPEARQRCEFHGQTPIAARAEASGWLLRPNVAQVRPLPLTSWFQIMLGQSTDSSFSAASFAALKALRNKLWGREAARSCYCRIMANTGWHRLALVCPFEGFSMEME